MDKKFALYIIIGMVLGAIYGAFFGPALGNNFLAIALGAIGGVFLGWFVAADIHEHDKNKRIDR